MIPLENLLGHNWRSTLSGSVAILAFAITERPELVAFLPESIRPTVVGIAGLLAVLSGGTFVATVKDRQVSGNATVLRPTVLPSPSGYGRDTAFENDTLP